MSRKRKDRKKAQPEKSGVAKSGHYYTTFEKHDRKGKKLLSPFAKIPNL